MVSHFHVFEGMPLSPLTRTHRFYTLKEAERTRPEPAMWQMRQEMNYSLVEVKEDILS